MKAEELRVKGDTVDRVRGVGVVGEDGGDGAGGYEGRKGGGDKAGGDGNGEEGGRELDLRFSKYDAVEGRLPTEEELEGVDAVLVSGASEWIFSFASRERERQRDEGWKVA